MTNHLAGSTSPYLLQHQNNPVNWYPWGEEALNKAAVEDKPIFLSIGYAACHWCHVMEHESFENESIAEILNKHFVAIKVDREQRPDLDHIYMQTVQMLTGTGGWPMSIFLTPEQKPFYAGTYWPPKRTRGRPGFDGVLNAVVDAWQKQRKEVASQSEEITRLLQGEVEQRDGLSQDDTPVLDEATLWNVDAWLSQNFDERWGGFGGAPKFPHAMDLRLLMALETRRPSERRQEIIAKTLDQMAAGGIYDHIGGGFARYSVDQRWLVPHFEKMLYDNALLAEAYLDGFLLMNNQNYAEVVRETLDYVLTDLTDAQGGFYSTRDADSEGQEGKFYVWSREEIIEVLGIDDGNRFCEAYGVTFGGNFEGKNILHLPVPLAQTAASFGTDEAWLRKELASDKQRLLARRNQRVWPGLDDKVVCSWNGLMISAMARAGVVLKESKYVEAAVKAERFIQQQMTRTDGQLWHVWRKGVAEVGAFLEDYANMSVALLTLFECTGDIRYVDRAVQWVEMANQLFADPRGGYYFTASNGETLIARYKDMQDGSVPSSNSMMAMALAKLASLTGEERWSGLAQQTIQQTLPLIEKAPAVASQMLLALDHWLGPVKESIYIASEAQYRDMAIEHAHAVFRPRSVVAFSHEQATQRNSLDGTKLESLVTNRSVADGASLVLYECVDRVCQLPKKIR